MGEQREDVVCVPWALFREESAGAAPARWRSRRTRCGTAELVAEPPPVFLRKDVILKELCVHKVQGCDSKEVIGV